MLQGVNTLIIEDEKEASDYLCELIDEKIGYLEVIGICTTVAESIAFLKEKKPELILMDVALPDGDAFEILDVFQNAEFEVIFITAHSEFMERALKYFAFSYLTKPYHLHELRTVIDRFLLKREKLFTDYKMRMFKDFILEKGTRFLLHLGSEHLVIDLREVICCKADGNYTIFQIDSGKKLMASHPLKYYEKLLSHKGFVRINRFNLINLSQITSIYKKEAIFLSDGTSIQISARHKNLLSDLIKDFNTK